MGRYGIGRTVVLGIGLAAAALALSAACVYVLAPSGISALPMLGAGAAAVAVALLVPVHWLPALALIAFAVLPLQLVPSEGIANVVRPTSILLGIWILRRWTSPRRDSEDQHPAVARFGSRFTVYVLAGLLIVWMGLTLAYSTALTTSAAWLSSFLMGAFLPLLVFDARAEAQTLKRAFLWLGGLYGAYAAVEQVVRANPLFDTIYALLGASVSSPWAVYRSEASFGHPLFLGAFLAIPAALGIGDWLTNGRRSSLVLGLLSALGVVMTVSRGSILAVGVAGVFAVLAAVVVRGGHGLPRVLGLGLIGAVALLALSSFAPLEERQSSTESDLSAGVREQAVDVALRAADASSWIGSGPGTSGITGRLFSDVVIENSLLQLLISIGVPGLLLFLALFGAAMLDSLRRGDLGPAAAIVAYVVAITGFNSLDAVRSMHALLGLLLLLALNGPAMRERLSPAPPPVRSPRAATRPRAVLREVAPA